MCVLYVSFESRVRCKIFGCIAMGSAILCILNSRFALFPAGSGVNRMQVSLTSLIQSPVQFLIEEGVIV